MAVSLSNARIGSKYSFLLHGSSRYGNASYTLDAVVRDRFKDARGNKRAILEEADGSSFEVYLTQRRWRYGSSAEVISILDEL